MSFVQVAWFVLIGVLLAGYVITDGFDLGVGFWYLLARKTDRPTLLATVLPYWDGNEVWLLAGGGAIFAAFPMAYATIFSALYLPLMLVIFALIFRAVSIEFRGQERSTNWLGFWDAAFGVGSVVPALLVGVAAGNVLRGLPLDAKGDYTGTFFALLNPYALLAGLTGLALILAHGALWIQMKTEGALAAQARKWTTSSWVAYMGLFILVALATTLGQPHLMRNFNDIGALWILPALAFIAAAMIGPFNETGKVEKAFLASSAGIVLLFATVGTALFPYVVPALDETGPALTISNASSSHLTLTVMLIMALVGMPIVVGYSFWVRSHFRGKVREDASHY